MFTSRIKIHFVLYAVLIIFGKIRRDLEFKLTMFRVFHLICNFF